MGFFKIDYVDKILQSSSWIQHKNKKVHKFINN